MKMINKKLVLLALTTVATTKSAFAGLGADAAAQVDSAATEANIVYIAVIAAFAAYFVVKLIRKAL